MKAASDDHEPQEPLVRIEPIRQEPVRTGYGAMRGTVELLARGRADPKRRFNGMAHARGVGGGDQAVILDTHAWVFYATGVRLAKRGLQRIAFRSRR